MSVKTYDTIPICTSNQDKGLCGLIAATTVQTTNTEWSCNSTGFTTTNPCAVGNVWTGITCVGNDIVSISKCCNSNTGIYIYLLYY